MAMKLKHKIPYFANHLFSRCKSALLPDFPVDAITADFYISIGCTCRSAKQLQRNKLRICSSPLDWMMSYTLKDAAELFRTGFSAFFSDIREHPNNGEKNRVVEDVRNGMLSLHHFPVSLSLEDGREAYRKRAERHFANTHRFLSDADRFVMVTHSTEDIESVCGFIDSMKALYKADIVHINIRNGMEAKRETVNLANGSILYDYTFDDINFTEKRGIPGRWLLGNDCEWRRILGKCRRTGKFSPPEKTGGDSI